ncbi:MAG: excisionase family DNA-binding protein [Candidatus Limnocylindrales bacterium]|jgi:excisionase family DNA binding protein
MTPQHEAAIQAATEQLVAALLAAVRAEAAATEAAPDRLLSVGQAAAMLGLGRSALYGQLEAGRLRSLRVGRRRLVPAGAVRDFIEGAGR